MSQDSDFGNMKRGSWLPQRPYNDLPLLPPTAEIETKPILKQCVESRAALAELKQAAASIPNPGILMDTLPLLEAQASSAIENIVTTADKLFRHSRADDASDPAAGEAHRYRDALLEGFLTLARRPMATGTAEAVCSRIKNVEMTVRRVPGTALANQATGAVVYTPPESGARLHVLLSNWEKFLHETDEIDPLVRMAVAHYQFEAIHPFTDGNGRTGRVLNILYLVDQGLLTLPILHLSRYIAVRRSDYYRLLIAVTREEDWESWILFMLAAVEETAKWTTAKIAAVRRLSDETSDHVRDALPKVHSRELVDLIFRQPYCRIGQVVDARIAQRQAASRYLKALVSVGVLEENAVGRERLFVHTKLLMLLTRDSNEFRPYRME